MDIYLSVFSPFSGFLILFYHMRWFYPYCCFKHSKWWRHNLGQA